MSDINVTPLVDVMLVLLVVFMITAPLLTVGVPIELPKTQAIAGIGYKERIYIKGDRNINYEIVMKVMGRISSAGYSSIGLITDLEE